MKKMDFFLILITIILPLISALVIFIFSAYHIMPVLLNFKEERARAIELSKRYKISKDTILRNVENARHCKRTIEGIKTENDQPVRFYCSFVSEFRVRKNFVNQCDQKSLPIVFVKLDVDGQRNRTVLGFLEPDRYDRFIHDSQEVFTSARRSKVCRLFKR